MTRLLLIAAALLVAATTGAVDLDSLLVQSIGGPDALDTIAAMTSYRTEGVANINGLVGEYTQLFATPDRFYMELRVGGMTLVSAYDGQTAWQRDHNGRISEIEGMEKQQLLVQVYLASYSFLLPDRLPGSAELLGDTTFADTVWHKAALYPLHEDTIVMLLDRQTALPHYTIQRLDNLTGVTHAADYRTVNGVEMAFSARTEFQEAELFTEMTTEWVVFNPDIESDLFRMPGSDHTDFRFEDGADSVVIPFEYYQGHIWVAATVNGVAKGWFILDSGASANLFTTSLVEPLDLARTGALPAKGLGGYEDIPLVRTDSVSIGSLTLTNQIAGTLDWNRLGIGGPHDKNVGGILGHDFLSRFPVLVDYQDSILTVYNPETFTAPPGGTEIDFHLTMLVPTITASVGSVSGDFIVDLGNSVGLVLHHRFYQDRKLDTILADIREVDRPLSGVGGEAETIAAAVPAFRIGDMVLSDLPVIIPESTHGLAGSAELAGNIGNMVLQEFRILFDYNRSRIYFYPPE